MISKLKGGFNTFRTRFGAPGVVALLALTVALGGTAAYAGQQAVSSAKAKKGPRGPAGPAGATGLAGPQGPAGVAGNNGTNGVDGEDGTDGTDGVDGEDGTDGVDGAPGSPWTAGGTLPSGETETGTFAYSGGTDGSGGAVRVAIGFPIPLSAAPNPIYVPGNNAGGTGTAAGCSGVVSGTPTADAGNLCVYEQDAAFNTAFSEFFLNPADGNVAGPSPAGVIVPFNPCDPNCYVVGTWAVTAP